MKHKIAILIAVAVTVMPSAHASFGVGPSFSFAPFSNHPFSALPGAGVPEPSQPFWETGVMVFVHSDAPASVVRVRVRDTNGTVRFVESIAVQDDVWHHAVVSISLGKDYGDYTLLSIEVTDETGFVRATSLAPFTEFFSGQESLKKDSADEQEPEILY